MASTDIGIFLPTINGWIVSTAVPQQLSTYELNKQVVQTAEAYGIDFVLTPVKLRGLGGKSGIWDDGLEAFTAISALAAITSRIKLFASSAILALPPAVAARMAATIDSIAPGRFGINIVTGWLPTEYAQMGLWPGDEYFGYRYDYATEYVQVMKELWKDGVSNFKGKYFEMDDCKLSPRPKDDVKIVAAGQSGRGIEFASQNAEYNFIFGLGVNTPTAHGEVASRLVEAAAKAGRDVGLYVLFLIIADETDEAAQEKWKLYNEGVDTEALGFVKSQTSKDSNNADPKSTSATLSLPEGAITVNLGTLIGSYEKIAGMLDEAAEVPGTKGIMFVFVEWPNDVEVFGQKIQPLMESRRGRIHVEV
ncbi:pyrimidine utilization protein A [Hypoxylon trugodes]|uniref:pyrimidine utilization protein A n=1 Tax=Hypoxylon trugodes TaxID=326681 RepID=UPI002191C80F|nr:pyrimidine utilization protein A [Hypoxylon trugodes]KAI1393820.1 pyrimidine utilization protein A [Hypoxylon trugodes]